MSDAADEVQRQLARKANNCRALADAIHEGDTSSGVTYGRANLLEELADDLAHLASRVQTELADSPR